MIFAEMMADGRARRGVTLEYASKYIGISLPYLCDYEKGRALSVKMDVIYKAAELYGIDVDSLCIAAGRLPKDVYYKLTAYPHLFAAVRQLSV